MSATLDGVTRVYNLASGDKAIGATFDRFGLFTLSPDGSFVDCYFDDISFTNNPIAPQWNVNADGNWTAAANWSTTPPNGVGATAKFGGIITSPRTVALDAPRTVGVISFDNANGYTISGTSTLTIDSATSNGSIAVLSGSHTIAAPIVLSRNTDVAVAVGQTLSVQHLRGAAISVKSGRLRIIAGAMPNNATGTSKLAGLTVTSGAVLDLTNNAMVLDYTGSTIEQSIRLALSDESITTSLPDNTRRIGYGESSTILGLAGGTFFGQTADATAILTAYTYAGDANFDGRVDITDLGAIATWWQRAGVWTGGDFDYNGFVDISDLGLLATNWQAGMTGPVGPGLDEALAEVGLSGVSIPEPIVPTLSWLVAALPRRRRG
jgi:hypothetical protein